MSKEEIKKRFDKNQIKLMRILKLVIVNQMKRFRGKAQAMIQY